jgi:hypothetical protein
MAWNPQRMGDFYSGPLQAVSTPGPDLIPASTPLGHPAGYWGVDCAISWGPKGKPQLLDGTYKPRKTGVKIYVYELPANLTSWCGATLCMG